MLLRCARAHSYVPCGRATATRHHLLTMKGSPTRPGHPRCSYQTMLALLAALVIRADGFARPPNLSRIAAPPPRRPSCAPRQRYNAPLMFYQGGVLGVGTPEVLVIAAVGYFLLGPEELYRLSKEIGKVVGQAREYVTKSAAEWQATLDGETFEFKEVRSRRPAVLRRFHAIDARRLRESRRWVVSFSILRPFGPRRATAMLHTGEGDPSCRSRIARCVQLPVGALLQRLLEFQYR